ncbi:MAG TPA: endonuclease V [Candidatus Bathyarchaeia archaeon]
MFQLYCLFEKSLLQWRQSKVEGSTGSFSNLCSRVGLAIGKPTVGVAKSRLIGILREKECRTLLFDKSEFIDEVVTTKIGVKPIYKSIGHMVSLDKAIKIVQHCSKGRIPEPLQQAHNLATKQRIKLTSESKVNI